MTRIPDFTTLSFADAPLETPADGVPWLTPEEIVGQAGLYRCG
jgi:hypothetical protein